MMLPTQFFIVTVVLVMLRLTTRQLCRFSQELSAHWCPASTQDVLNDRWSSVYSVVDIICAACCKR